MMTGGKGDDVYIVDDTKDKVVEGTDPGHDRVESKATYVLTANVEDLVLTGIDNINGTGNNLKNDITGNSGNNVLDGLAGPDTMHGGDGDDIYVLDDVDKLGDLTDVVDESGGSGSDTLKTGMRSIDLDADTAFHVEWTDLENVWLTGSKALGASGDAGNNKLTGNTAANRLEGRDGDDTMDGGAGADTMIGGKGNDTYTIDNVKDVIDESGGDGIDTVSSFVTYTLADGFENITLLGKANINATGSALNNIIVGNDGINIVDGLGGADDMTGGKGNDTYFVDNAGDKLHENANEGTDSVKVANLVDFTLGAELENLTLLEGASKNGTGNGVVNAIIGNSNDNVLSGLAGNDTLTGGDGNDTLDGGFDNDIMNGGKGDDVFFIDSTGDKVIEGTGQGIDTVKSEVTHTLGGNFENLTLLDDGDEDTVENAFGNGGKNVIIGNSENNFIDGLGGDDTMQGGKGDDLYRLSSKGDVIIEAGGEGTDLVQSGITIDHLAANVENIFLFGQTAISASGNDLANKIQGSFGSNHLFGLEGNDTLIGAGGTDTLIGGDGRDSFQRIKVPGEGIDVVADFQVSATTGDFLDITDMLTNSKGEDIFTEGSDDLSQFVHVVQSGANTLVQVDANGGANGFTTVYVLQNVSLTQDQVEAQILTEHPT
jgi:trimeric autotransporter adhesin